MTTITKDARTALISMVFFTVLCGLAYPLAMTGVAQAVFPNKADGSLLYVDGHAGGSGLIGQNFSAEKYFHPRPSAAGPDGYDASASSGSNLGPSSQTLVEAVSERIDRVRDTNGLSADAKVPVDAVTASSSGLDPHISPAYADLQVARVARARSMSEDAVRALVKEHTSGSTLLLLGEPRVNVLQLNVSLDSAR
jgi:potassium-transporting ATPase KdpC subunit